MKKLSKENENGYSKESRFSKIKKGEYFRFKGGKKVYVFEGGGKVRGYNYYNTEDINDNHTTKTDRIIEIGFTY